MISLITARFSASFLKQLHIAIHAIIPISDFLSDEDVEDIEAEQNAESVLHHVVEVPPQPGP